MRREYKRKVWFLTNRGGSDVVVIFSNPVTENLAEIKLKVSEGYLK